MIIDCVSDLHGHLPNLDGGDLLIIAGDLTAKDEPGDYLKFFAWIAKQKYRKKIVIAGNHDMLIQKGTVPMKAIADFEYLEDSGTEFEGLKIWGSPWTPWFSGVSSKCKAFMKKDYLLTKYWEKIPPETDILVTHCPPRGFLDYVGNDKNVGSKSLCDELDFRKENDYGPLYHVFGHIHENGGMEIVDDVCLHANCSLVNRWYEPVNLPVRIVHDFY